jgi:transposase, IS30 family
MAEHRRFTVDSGVAVYVCDRRSRWQRGSSENTNELLRHYFPRGRSLAGVTEARPDEVAARLNVRPRQTLGWMAPADKLAELLDSSTSDRPGADLAPADGLRSTAPGPERDDARRRGGAVTG